MNNRRRRCLLDIDECENGHQICSYGCRNLIGSYECYCEEGFELSSNKRNCDGKFSN